MKIETYRICMQSTQHTVSIFFLQQIAYNCINTRPPKRPTDDSWATWPLGIASTFPCLSHTNDLTTRTLMFAVLAPGFTGSAPDFLTRRRYHGGRRPSSDDSFHSPTVIPISALDKPSITKRYHRRRTCSHTSPRSSPKMVTLHDIRFVECRRWNGGWTVKIVVTWRSSASLDVTMLWPGETAIVMIIIIIIIIIII